MDEEEELNPDDVWILRYADPENPNNLLTRPIHVPREQMLQAMRENPDLQAVVAPGDPETLRALADRQDMDLRREIVEDMPVAGRLAAAGLNFANQMSFGLPSLLMDEDERRTAQATEEAYPITSGVAAVAGAVAPALATGGATVAEAGLANLVPGVLPQALGNTVGRTLFRRLAPSMGARGARGAALAGELAVDGTVAGLQEGITQANIQGTPLDAQTILANGLFGAGLGLGAGGILGAAVGRGGRRATQQVGHLVDSGMGPRGVIRNPDGSLGIADIPNAESDTWFTRLVTSPIGRVASGLTGEGDDVAFRRLAHPGAMQEAQGGMEYTRRVQRLADDGTDIMARARERVTSLRDADFRQSGFRALAGAEDTALAGRMALTEKLAPLTDAIKRSAHRIGTSGVKRGKEIERWANSILDAGDAPEMATRLDDFLAAVRQQRLGDVTDSTLRGHIADVVKTAESALEEMGAPGAAAVAAQRAVQAYDEAIKDLRGRAVNYKVAIDEENLNPGAIFQSVSDSGYRVKNDLTADLGRLNSSLEQATRVAERHYGISPDTLYKDIEQNIADIAEARRTGELIATYRDLSGRSANSRGVLSALGVPGIAVGGAVGAAVGGPAGAAIGGAIGLGSAVLTNPLSALQHLSGLGAAKKTSQTRMADSLNDLRRTLKAGRRAQRLRVGVRALPKAALSLRSKEEKRKEYKAITEQLRELTSNPEKLMDVVADATDSVDAVSPELAGYMAQAYVRGVQYLVSELPPSSAPSLWGHLEKLEPSSAEMESFIRRFEAIEDPLGIVSMAASYSLTAEHVQAAQTVYPELFSAIQAEVTSILGDLDSMPPFSARMQVGTLLNVPADPSLDPQFVHRLQQRYAQTAQQQQEIGPRQITSGAKRLATDTYSASASLTQRLSQTR